MEQVDIDDSSSSYHMLPAIPEQLVDRDFLLKDDNVEITSMDIASHGSFLVAGSSSGMILLFDLSNPSAQTDGLLIGQIRARGMHTNLIVTVKFSEDGRFVFAGVSKGSSEMLAIDLGKVLVDWNAANAAVVNRGSSDALQQLQLSSMVTFSFSDAKLRGFGAVVRMDAPCSSKNGGTSTSFRDSSALYRLACGKGIKNVHIWHFRVGYLEGAGNGAGASDLQAAEHKQLHGKWEYVCDVASNGNTITHIEFRQSGNELLSKSAGMCIRLWDLQSNSCSRLTEEAAGAVDANKDGEAFAVNDAVTPAEDSGAPVAAAAPVTGYVMLKPSYVDIANSQDVKCMLPIGTGAYGGTYQFAVLNTAAPREANRDVLELPERFSGDAAVVSGIAGGGNSATQAPASSAASAFLPAGRGRRITREIEQVICTDEGKHAIILCADGGVVYYNVPLSSNNAAGVARKHAAADGGSSSDEQDGSAGAGNSSSSGSGAGQLVELGALFRVKDQQQHPGSWALRRVGRQGMVVLLRATTSSTTSGAQSSRSGVTVEVRQLAAHVSGDAADWVAPTASVGTSADAQQEQQALSLCYYQDSSAMEAQKALRRTWVLPANSSALSSKRQNIGSAGSAGAGSGAKRSKQSSNNTPAAAILEALSTANTDSVPRKRKALSIQDDNRSPGRPRPAAPSSARRSSSATSGADADGGSNKYVTPAAVQASSARHNRISPTDDADRLASGGNIHYAAGDGCSVSPTVSPRARLQNQGSLSRVGSRQQMGASASASASSAASTLARLRALRDDDEGPNSTAAMDEPDQADVDTATSWRETIAKGSRQKYTADVPVRRELPSLQVAPAPKVQRVAVAPVRVPAPVPIVSSSPACISTTATSTISSSLKSGFTLHSAGVALVDSWLAGCGAVTTSLASPSGGALVGGTEGAHKLGLCGLERLGVIWMEQDRVKALFVREVVAAMKAHLSLLLQQNASRLAGADVVSELVCKYKGVAGELVQRQQLDLQGACAVDAVVRGGFIAGSMTTLASNASASTSTSTSAWTVGGGTSSWGDAFKVCYRHNELFERALQLQASVKRLLLSTDA